MTSATNCKGPHSTIAVFHKDTSDIIGKQVYEILWDHFIESECIHDSAFAHRIVRHGSTHFIIQFHFNFLFVAKLLSAFYRKASITSVPVKTLDLHPSSYWVQQEQ